MGVCVGVGGGVWGRGCERGRGEGEGLCGGGEGCVHKHQTCAHRAVVYLVRVSRRDEAILEALALVAHQQTDSIRWVCFLLKMGGKEGRGRGRGSNSTVSHSTPLCSPILHTHPYPHTHLCKYVRSNYSKSRHAVQGSDQTRAQSNYYMDGFDCRDPP